jgi:hypothetical protein
MEYHVMYNRKPLKQFREVNTKYYDTDKGQEVFTNTYAKGVIVPPGNPFYDGYPAYLQFPDNE